MATRRYWIGLALSCFDSPHEAVHIKVVGAVLSTSLNYRSGVEMVRPNGVYEEASLSC